MTIAGLIRSRLAPAFAGLLALSAAAMADDLDRLKASPIGRLAEQVEPGTIVRIETDLPRGMTKLSDLFRVRVDDGRRLSIDGWTDSAHWDPQRKRTFFIGMRLYKKFISYDAINNAWEELGWEGEPPPKFEKFGHVYGRTALDWKRGHYYWLSPGNVLSRYLIDDARWEAIRDVPIGGYISMEWHEKLDELIAITPGGKVFAFREGSTRQVGESVVDGYHSVGEYNRTRGEMLFAGGNHSLRKVSAIAADGTIRTLRDAPFDISIKNTSLTYDPVSGNYLFFQLNLRQVHEYDPVRDEWRIARRWSKSEWPFGAYGLYTPVAIDELGIVFMQSESGNQVYRHRPVSTSNLGDMGS